MKKSRCLWLVKNNPGQSSDLSLIVTIHILDLIITESEVWPICHCVGIGDETTACAICLSMSYLNIDVHTSGLICMYTVSYQCKLIVSNHIITMYVTDCSFLNKILWDERNWV